MFGINLKVSSKKVKLHVALIHLLTGSLKEMKLSFVQNFTEHSENVSERFYKDMGS